ncbi:MAG: iron ABC transporter permease [Silicimonas sp.]|jgi:predicted secreted hydrolase|nr:iron ABC transporter permease [Silicimonas sp.]
MSARFIALLLLLVLQAADLSAQGFAGLGQTTDGHALPDPATRFEYPADHGAHPDFRIEWWYVTANLTDADGRDYGIQWTLFRSALAPGGAPEDQAWMAHAAVSAPDGHRAAERFARGGSGQAGVTASPFEAFIDEWQMAGPSLTDIRVTAQGTDFQYDLALAAGGPFIAQGQNGFSVKSEAGQASHYYSQPFYSVTGTLTFPTGTVEVTGRAWLDREWSSQPLTEDQTGWDWVSLHFEDGDKLMGYRMRNEDGSAYTVGTWIGADGTATPLEPGDLVMTAAGISNVAGRTVPTAWDIALPARQLSIKARAIYPDSWMNLSVSYWEGPVRVTGSHSGTGYLEMSGY